MVLKSEKPDIWNNALSLANEIYKVTKTFPRTELYLLTDRLRRSACTIASNIAEGLGSPSKKDLLEYIDQALQSTHETANHLSAAKKHHYLSNESYLVLNNKAEQLSYKLLAYKDSKERRS